MQWVAPSPSPIGRTEAALLTLVLIVLAAVAVRPSIRGNDGVGHYVYLVSILRDGDLDLSDDYRDFDVLKQYPYHFADLPVSEATGLPSNRYGIGAALLWAPFVFLLHGLLSVISPQTADPLTHPYACAVAVGSIFWGSLGLWLLYGWLRQRFDRLVCAAVLAGLLFATPLGFYLYAHGSMSHGIGFFAAAGFLVAFDRAWQRPSIAPLAWCGFWSGLLVMTRFQDATWVLAVVLLLFYRAIRPPRESGPLDDSSAAKPLPRWAPWVGLVTMGLVALILFIPQMVVWKILYGSWLSGPTPYLTGLAGHFSWWPRHLFAVLFSERGGVLAWHPILLAGLIGLGLLYRREHTLRNIVALGLLGFIFQLWLIGSWSMWWGGASFGNRFFIGALPFLTPGMAFWIASPVPRRRALARSALALLIVWNMGLLVQYATEMIPREEAVSWWRVIRQNVIDVPAWLIDRLF